MSQQSLRESMSKNNQNPRNQISVRAIATGYNKRGISSDSRQDQNRYNSNNNLDALSNLITQQVEFRPNTSSPMNNINVINPRSIVNSPRQNEHNRGSTVSPTNRIVAQNPKPVTGNRFLPKQSRENLGKKTLILDLDETLVHSAFKPFSQRSDILLNVELDKKIHIIHVLKRPGAEEFIERMAKHYEVVIFTASLSAYANPLMDQLDSKRHCCHRLFREHCTSLNGVFVKDMSKLGRDLKDVIIVDNNPGSFSFHKENGIPIKTWYSDKSDRDLYNLTPILEALAYVNDVRDHLKKFCFNNEVNYKIAHSLAASLSAQNNQNRSQNQPQLASDRILSPSNSQNYLSNSGSDFYPSSKANFNASNPYAQQERSYFNQGNPNKENAYGSRISDANNYNSKANLINNTNSYVNNVMPVNKKMGLDNYSTNLNNNSASAKNPNYTPGNFSRQNPNSGSGSESPYNPKSILPANKFPNNNENSLQPENTFLNAPFNASGKLNTNNRSFNNYKPTLDEESVGTTDLNNPNISINIINHNYSHYFVNPEDEKKRLGPGLADERDIKLEKYNTSAALRPNNLAEKYNVSNYQNRPPLNNMNYNPMNFQNYPNNNMNKEARANEKKSKYSNINLFRSGNPNINNSFGNTNNNNNSNNINSNSYLNRQFAENRGNFSKNPANVNNNNLKNANYESYRGGDLNNFDKRLLQTSKQAAPAQGQEREKRDFTGSNNSDNYYNNNNNINPSNLNRYNSFLSDKYSSKISSRGGRPSSAVLVGQSNPNHLSRYPLSSQQTQSFINNNHASNNDGNNNLGAYSKEKNFANASNNLKNNFNSNNSIQPKNPSNNPNFGLTMIDRKNPHFREHSANPNLRSFNSGNFSAGNNYINQNYYQMNNSNNNTNLINNPQKQKFGNNLTSSVNNFDMDFKKNIGNRTSRPGTSLNENKGITRDFSLGTPKRPIDIDLANTININNNNANNQGNSFLYAKNSNNPRSPNSNYGMINKSFNALTAKDLVYEEFNSNREAMIKNNYSGNNNVNMAISRSVERSKFKPSTPNYQSSNNYFSQNRHNINNNISNNNDNNYHQKQNSEKMYSSLIHNFPVYTNEQKNFMNRKVNTPTAHNYRSTPTNNYQNYQNHQIQSNGFGMNKPNQYRNYEYYYNNNNNPSANLENKAAEQVNNFSKSMRERFYPIGGDI